MVQEKKEKKEKEKEEEGQEAPYNWLTPDRPPLAAFTGIFLVRKEKKSKNTTKEEETLIFEIGLGRLGSQKLNKLFFRNWLGKCGKWGGIILIYFSNCSGKVERRMLHKLIILENAKIIYEVERGKI